MSWSSRNSTDTRWYPCPVLYKRRGTVQSVTSQLLKSGEFPWVSLLSIPWSSGQVIHFSFTAFPPAWPEKLAYSSMHHPASMTLAKTIPFCSTEISQKPQTQNNLNPREDIQTESDPQKPNMTEPFLVRSTPLRSFNLSRPSP